MPVFSGVATGLAMTAVTKARAACLIGWPAAHSRSPLIHHYWLRALGIEGGYNIEAVPPEGFAEFVLHLSTHGFVGANVTIPHKERALALTKPDERARAVGAANTLWYEGAELRSTNTDIEGFIGNLDACAQGWDAAGDAHHRTRPCAGGSIRPQCSSGRMGCDRRAAAARGPLGQHDVAWHARPARAGARRRPAAVTCRCCRSRICAAGNTVACRGAGARTENRRWARHAAAPGGARVRTLVRPAPRGDVRASRAG